MLWRLRLLPVAMLMIGFVLGCGEKAPPVSKDVGGDSGSGDGGKKKTPVEKLASKGSGAIEGKITFDGDPPKAKDLTEQINMKAGDAAHCKMGKTEDETWVVGGADKGVANVIVWLKAPSGKYFEVPEKQRDRSSEVITLGQPFCAFEPHVIVLYPSYYDGEAKKQKPTNQKFRVINNATIAHNTNVTFADSTVNAEGLNAQLPAKKGDKMEERDVKAKSGKDNVAGGEQSFKIGCNIHPWMNAHGRIFDHPFFAITTGGKADDKEFGAYKIENAPAGAEVELWYWHESMQSPKMLKKVTLKDNDKVTEDFKIK